MAPPPSNVLDIVNSTSPPPVLANATAADYSQSGVAYNWHFYVLPSRYNTVTFTGEYFPPYLFGLLIVPIICAIALVLWVLLLLIGEIVASCKPGGNCHRCCCSH